MVDRNRIRLGAECAREQGVVLRFAAQPDQQRGAGPLQAQLDRMLAEHRHERLILELGQRRVSPGQRRGIGDVDQAHAAARVQLARGAGGLRAAVGERALLLVTRGARLSAVRRQAGIVKKVPAELGLCLRHEIGRGHARPGEVPRQLHTYAEVVSVRPLMMASPASHRATTQKNGRRFMAVLALLEEAHDFDPLQHADRPRTALVVAQRSGTVPDSRTAGCRRSCPPR
jgi:hypothetical protein